MDSTNKNELTDKVKQPSNLKNSELKTLSNKEKPAKRVRRQPTEEELNNPFHGVKLREIVERLVDFYGWEYMGDRVNIRCFIHNPTMKSSLGFLRRTQWAREQVEDLYLEMLDDKELNEKAKEN